MPGHPNQLNSVEFVSPESEVTSPPLDSEDVYSPSMRFTERGSRFETMIRFRFSWEVEPIIELRKFIRFWYSYSVYW